MELKNTELQKLVDINDKLKETIKELKDESYNLDFERTNINVDLDDIEDEDGNIDYDMLEDSIMEAFDDQLDTIEYSISEIKRQINILDEYLKDYNYLIEDLTIYK